MAPTVILDTEDVRAVLTMEDSISAVETAMIAVSTARCTLPPRLPATITEKGAAILLMSAACDDLSVYAVKSLSLHPQNSQRGLPLIHGTITLFDRETGVPVSIMDGKDITALRTAAASAVATKWLARTGARTLGVLGTGVQARHHVSAITTVCPIERIIIWGRSHDKAVSLVEVLREDQNVSVTSARNASEAAACDIVCTVTNAETPILRSEWLYDGSHVNLVGGHQPSQREADTNLIRRARLFVDSYSAALAEAGDILIPIDEGAITIDHVKGEIGEVIAGAVAGRMSDSDITLYKSVGVASQDLYVASQVLERARSQGIGRQIEL